MKIAILGYAGQGKSSFDYWNRDGNEITICDKDINLEFPLGTKAQLGDDYLKDLDKFDLLIRTPALHPKEIINANNSQIVDKIWSNTNEFMKVCPTRNIIGVTGTKGKGTTSTLIAKILEAAGKRVHLGGNIGIPPLELLKKKIHSDDWVVLELANFQLIDLKISPQIAVCLMVEPEHMDWHTDFEEYKTAKKQLFTNQTETDTAVYYAKNENSKTIAAASAGRHIPYFESPGAVVEGDLITIGGTEICNVNELKLLGQHNWQNACAAVTAVWQIIQNPESIQRVLTEFSGLEHRLELVREYKDIKYYDDSFGTTPETAIVAIEAFEQPKVLILGGSDKGASYEKLAETVKKGNVRQVICIGDTGSKIASALQLSGYTAIANGGATMHEIVATTQRFARAGDIVLLSTGCASFGLFKNYKDRGEQFKQAVQALS